MNLLLFVVLHFEIKILLTDNNLHARIHSI